jgi:hypothetical protein
VSTILETGKFVIEKKFTKILAVVLGFWTCLHHPCLWNSKNIEMFIPALYFITIGSLKHVKTMSEQSD